MSSPRLSLKGNQHARLLAVLSLLVVSSCQPATSDWVRLEPSIPAPAFTLQQLDDGTVSLASYRGRVVIMEFWATWCGPCRYSTPSLDSIYRRYRHQEVTVLLINEREPAERIRAWVERRFMAPILLDTDGRVAERYQVAGIPRLFIVDQHGQIVYDRSGYGGGLEQNLTLVLKELLTSNRAVSHGG